MQATGSVCRIDCAGTTRDLQGATPWPRPKIIRGRPCSASPPIWRPGRTTSRALVEAALARIADPAGEGARTFTKVYADSARAAADAQDQLRQAGYVASPLAGLPVSIKDLFDVAGEVTLAGSTALDDRPPAAARRADRRAAARGRRGHRRPHQHDRVRLFRGRHQPALRHARATRTTAARPRRLVRRRAGLGRRRLAVVAIGTDTGGSVRIPAALCGVVGFKPTAKRISRDGATPLSTTLDSIGPLANSIACCAITDAVMAGEAPRRPTAVPVDGLRLGVPQSFVLDDLAPEVAGAFADACTALSRAGARIVDLPLAELGEYPRLSDRGGLRQERGLCLARGAAGATRQRIRPAGARRGSSSAAASARPTISGCAPPAPI